MTRVLALMARGEDLLIAPFRGRRALSTYCVAFASLGFCLTLLAGTQATNPAHTDENPPPKPKVRFSPEVVNVYANTYVDIYAVVEDRKGRLVSNLDQEDFRVTEENVPQQIQYFSRETDAPLTIGTVVDTSPSQGSVLAIEQQQAKSLIRQVLRPNDSGFVLHFDERVELLQDLTDDQQLLARAIDGTVIHEPGQAALSNALSPTQPGAAVGGSHLYDTICFASKLLMNQVGRNVLVLLTDGEDVGSEAKLGAALEAAEKANLIIYSVVVSDLTFYEDRGLRFHGDSVLKKFSLATGGRMSRGKDALSTASAFGQIGGELRGQYLLRYTPSQKGDGSFRKIKVEVPHGNYRVRARRGYYAEPE